MGLFDQMTGGMLNAMLSQAGTSGGLGGMLGAMLNGPMAQAVPGVLNGALAKTDFGSIDGFLASLSAGGLSDEVASWLSCGQNIPVSANEIVAALGEGRLAQVANAVGLPADQIATLLSEHLPAIIDRLSPNGTLELPGR